MDTEKIKRQTGINKVIFKNEVTSTNDEILNEKQGDTLMISIERQGKIWKKVFLARKWVVFFVFGK